jgi:hypothetical protein
MSLRHLTVAALSASAIALAGPVSAASAAYVHLENCKAALTGANGDNDVYRMKQDFSWVPITEWSWSVPVTRYSNTDVTIPINMYRYGHFWGGSLGECWGDDSNISDRIYEP